MKILIIEKSEDTMIQYSILHPIRLMMTITLIVTGIIATGTEIANSHGGKTHVEEPFPAFQAVQKAVQLYDRLIVSGKLPEDWETDLEMKRRYEDQSNEPVAGMGMYYGYEGPWEPKAPEADPNLIVQEAPRNRVTVALEKPKIQLGIGNADPWVLDDHGTIYSLSRDTLAWVPMGGLPRGGSGDQLAAHLFDLPGERVALLLVLGAQRVERGGLAGRLHGTSSSPYEGSRLPGSRNVPVRSPGQSFAFLLQGTLQVTQLVRVGLLAQGKGLELLRPHRLFPGRLGQDPVARERLQ